MDNTNGDRSVRVLCSKLVIQRNEPGLQWLIGSQFFPPFAIVSTFRCLHTLPPSPFSPHFYKESEDLRMLILRGFDIIGALIVGADVYNSELIARKAVDASRTMRKLLAGKDNDGVPENRDAIGAVAELDIGEVRFFVSKGVSGDLETVNSVVYEDNPVKYVLERGCFIRCKLPIKLPFYFPVNGRSSVDEIFSHAIEKAAAEFKDSQVSYMVETSNKTSTDISRPVIVRGVEFDFHSDLSNVKHPGAQGSDAKFLLCSHFCSKSKRISPFIPLEDADVIQVSILRSRSGNPTAPVAEYVPALEEVQLAVVDYELEVLCYAARDLPLTYAISKLIVPALIDQLSVMKNVTLPNLLTEHPHLRPYHFIPPGIFHPITVIYELNYGETEMKQVEIRKSLHLRLGLSLDRPLLRVANALNFSITMDSARNNSTRKGSSLLKDVHIGIPSSGVSGGFMSLVQGSYEYYHYLQDGFDDSGWGCAYRSLQTIISWFILQHYTSVDVPSHREIQRTLVEIGDKDPSFIGSREWIGAIELSFVLDKLLGVSCKVINVRSGAELPEKCRELALHFQNQGTPIMIGGGVLAYTLLGVDYNEMSGDCAFLILDPHYTGSDDLKKIVNVGWCGWKKAVDGKGRNFFLHDKFYNLLLPQRPSMV